MIVTFAWSGLPPYAAYCIREVSRRIPGRVNVLATIANVPHKKIEEILGLPVVWIENNKILSWAEIKIEKPDVFIHSGWAYPAFNSLAKDAPNALRVGMVDNIWRGTAKQWLGLAFFRLFYRRRFDAMLVPGKKAERFCQLMGMPRQKIYQGMYGSSPEVFVPGPPLSRRAKRIVFIGQFIERKGITEILKAAQTFIDHEPDWEIVLVGDGPLRKMADDCPAVRVEQFASPEKLAEHFRESRFLLLPSVHEHWGVVVHEATLCGCGLILSHKVGAVADLFCENGFLVPPLNTDILGRTLLEAAALSDTKLDAIGDRSKENAISFGPQRFAASVERIIKTLVLGE